MGWARYLFLPFGEYFGFPGDIKSGNNLFFPAQDPENSEIPKIFSRLDSRLIALDNMPYLIFTARLRVASK